MVRFRSVLAILAVVLSLGLHVEGPHGHHCILEEAACAACRTAVTPTTAAPPATHTVASVAEYEFGPALVVEPVLRLRSVLIDAPLRAPPTPVEIA